MELVYLDTAQEGLAWLQRYYREHPQLDMPKAVASLLRAETVLQDNPFAGARYEDFAQVRAYPLQGTTFSLLYTVVQDTVWIIDLHDQRGYRGAEALQNFAAELRSRLSQ